MFLWVVGPNYVAQMTEQVSAADRINELYQVMLGRLPDPDAHKSCLAFLTNGGTLEILAQEIERSAEYQQWQTIVTKIEQNRKHLRLDKNRVSQVPEIYPVGRDGQGAARDPSLESKNAGRSEQLVGANSHSRRC